VVPDNGLLLEVAGLTDIFCRANAILPPDSRLPRYRCRVVSATRRRTVEGGSGLRIAADLVLTELDPTLRYDTVIVTGGGGGARPRSLPAVAAWFALAARKARRVASVCTGAFVLAEAGLLRDKRATTHWKCVAELAAQYPQTQVETDPIFVHDGKVHTSAGGAAGLDLALSFVEDDLGPDLAREVARHLVLYLRRPGGQSQFSAALEREARADGPIRDLQSWILDNLHHDLRVERLAERVAMSPRHFARVFHDEVGIPPARYVEELRVEEAKRRLEQGDEILERTAAECGFGTALGLRRAFQRHQGVTPGEYRERFGRI
jgi:transcriptional regulator GlxA family with amidase domain